MKISKAIAILTIHNDHNLIFTDDERREAHQLGIEALKHHRDQTRHLRSGHPFSLPGETPEDG